MADIQLKYFVISASGDQAAEEALNRFLRGHQVLQVQQEFVADGANSVWYVAVRYAQAGFGRGGSERSGIDYKDELEPEAFARFVELKKRRKLIAEAENLPAFAVFTDKELAGIAVLENPQPADLKKVKGIGSNKVERFGTRILTPIADEEKANEAGGKSA